MTDEREILGFLQSAKLDKPATYLQNGRVHQVLSVMDLRSEWVAAFKRMAQNPTDPSVRDAHESLDIEFEVRKLEQPYELVKTELELFIASVDENILDLKQTDPDRFADMNADLVRDLEAFKKAKGAKN